MTLVAHLTELRRRVGLSLLFILLGTALAFSWSEPRARELHPRSLLRPARKTFATATPTVAAGY